jgi:uncharacterized protein (TIGR03086 family)
VPQLDLEPAARVVAGLLGGVRDDQLADRTPSEGMPVAALLDHLMGLCLAFTWGARRVPPPDAAAGPPRPTAEHLEPGWRTELPRRLGELVDAWREPAAWTGRTQVGGVTLPAAQMGVVALDELVMHGWDLARATGQHFGCDAASVAAVLAFTEAASRPEAAPMWAGLFGPVVEVPPDAPPLDRALGYAGRDPQWSLARG